MQEYNGTIPLLEAEFLRQLQCNTRPIKAMNVIIIPGYIRFLPA